MPRIKGFQITDVKIGRLRIDWNSYDYIWLTDPLIANLIKKNTKTKIIYDCMDDCLEFSYLLKYIKLKDKYFEAEKNLINTADAVICSAVYLKEKILSRYSSNRKISVINNAITSSIQKRASFSQNNVFGGLEKPFIYVSTISEWFDFDNIIKALNEFKTLNIVLIGPVRTSYVPTHERLILKGAINHDQILDVMLQAHALIMPFTVSEFIKSVNPIKLYEYIYCGKPILASKYGETLKFSKHITLYSNYGEMSKFFKKNLEGAATLVKSSESMRDFVVQNTWDNRYLDVRKIFKNDL